VRLKRQPDGTYRADTDVGVIIVRKGRRMWFVHRLDENGELEHATNWGDYYRTLDDVRRCGLLEYLVKCRDYDRRKRAEKTAGIIRTCRLKDSRECPTGIPWWEWAESFVGCTAAEVKSASRQACIDAYFDEIEDEFSPDDIDDLYRRWRGE